jgi:hypothetical protein
MIEPACRWFPERTSTDWHGFEKTLHSYGAEGSFESHRNVTVWVRMRTTNAKPPGRPTPVLCQALAVLGMLLLIMPVSESEVEIKQAH